MTDPLAPVRAKFLLRCRDDLAVLDEAGDSPHLRAVIHRIAGVAGMFGYGDVSLMARALDERGPSDGPLTPAGLAALRQAVAKIAAAGDDAL